MEHTPNPEADRLTLTDAPETEAMQEPKADPLAGIAVDANALAGAIWSGQGTDVGKLVEDLLKSRPAA